MRNNLFISAFLIFTACVFSQNNTNPKLSFEAISIELHTNNYPTHVWKATKDDFLHFAENDSALKSAPSGISSGYGQSYQSTFLGVFSSKVFFRHSEHKKFQPYIGISVGLQQVLSLSHLVNYYDTTSSYQSSNTNQKLYQVANHQHSYFFSLTSKKIQVPFGILFASNSKNRVWFFAGLELSPGVTYDNLFQSNYIVTTQTLILNEQSDFKKPNSYTRDFMNSDVLYVANTKMKIDGLGFFGTMALPLGVNLRVSKNHRVLNKLCLFTQLTPFGFIVANRITTNQLGVYFNTCIGLRFSL